MRKNPSIISRIIRQHLLALIATSVVVSGAAYFLLNSTINSFEQRNLRERATAVAKYLTLEGGQWSFHMPGNLQAVYAQGYGGYGLTVSDDTGKTLYASLPQQGSVLTNPRPQAGVTLFQNKLGNSIYYLLLLPVNKAGRTAWIEIGQNSANPDVIVDDVLARFLRRIAWIVLPIFGSLLLLDTILLKNILRPVLAASKIAANISSSQFSERLPEEDLPLEIRPLASAVNAALDRLGEALRAQREFTADAAHELRTPLAILRTHIETKLDSEAARELLAEVDSAVHILNQLLELAEMEGESRGRQSMADLNDEVAGVVAQSAPQAIADGKGLELVPCPKSLVLLCNWGLVSRALTNLIDNALRYTPPGGNVTIEVVAPDSVHILDRGPGVRSDHRKFIFRRFWRGDRQSRGHAGLGLAIVAKIAQLHGGSITLADRPGGGSIFQFSLGKSSPAGPVNGSLPI